VRSLLGRWAEQPTDAGLLARKMAVGMARTVLDGGRDVVIPQFLARPEFVSELERLAGDVGARFVEVALMAGKVEMHRWFAARSGAPGAATHRDAQVLVERLGGLDALDQMHDGFVRLVESRPRTRRIPARAGDVDSTFVEFEQALADDASD
jgi:hypothetical protein